MSDSPKLWISSAAFSDGNRLDFRPDDLCVFVGPNNAGKSVALKNLEEKTKDTGSPGVVVGAMTLDAQGTEEDVVAWLDRTSRKSFEQLSYPKYTRMGASVYEPHARQYWANREKGLQGLAPFFVCHLSTEKRLTAANPAKNIALMREAFTHPIHYLQADDSIETRFSKHFHAAFGDDLVVNRNAGKEVPLHCGRRPELEKGEDRVSIGYLRKLERLPTLHSQGDGMRAFVGVLLYSLVLDHSVLLIDEPEAFLHPPQARALGRMLVRETPRDRQLFLATHSGDLLRGLLDEKSSRVRIIRIQREGDVNKVTELRNEGIRELWGDPILRYSNILDGIFHDTVVVCESDADCRFYAAVADAIGGDSGVWNSQHRMFVHCGGKDRIPTVVTALRGLGVPVRVVVDFDVLRDEEPLHPIYSKLGGDWDQLAPDWRNVREAVAGKKPELASVEVKEGIESVLSKVTDQFFPRGAASAIQAILRRSSPWSQAKSVGKAFVPSGQPTQCLERVLEAASAVGVFVVPSGELEGFDRSVGGHGPTWVNAVLGKNLADDPELEDARRFVRSVLEQEKQA